jgi:hypothetical protein
MNGRGVHRSSTLVMSSLMALIGVALVVQALLGHSSVLSGRLILGVLFFVAGLGRLYVEVRRGRGSGA